MTEPSALSDSQLMARAHLWRRKSMMGSRDAAEYARAHEIEMRRRLGATTTMDAPLSQGRVRRRKWWRLW
ncbi:hypothetical protein WKW79_31380 [Variovorax robiniae]|uniref:Uncharacterized protein n=1 Tax=Variovorax robiniae TaxID=1836199 RepID=A0ABU8XGV8_9BURK